jgi:CxxC motif-containing protein
MNGVEQRKTYICTICPKGCEITAKLDQAGELTLSGASCNKGEDYVRKEMLDPRRILTTSVLVAGGSEPLVSVRTQTAIPRRLILEAVAVLRNEKTIAPVRQGQIIVSDLLGTGIDVIATKSIPRQKS